MRRLAPLALLCLLLSAPAARADVPPGGSVTGSVFADANANGVRDQGEMAMSGWVVWADLDRDGTLQPAEPSTPTDGDGHYALGGVPAGTQSIVARPSTGAACPGAAVCARDVAVADAAPATLDFPVPQAGGQILIDEDPAVLIGKVKLRVPRGCRRSPFAVTLTGNGVKRVDFSVDGRLVRSVRRPAANGSFSTRVSPSRLRRGPHTLTAAVWFSATARSPGKRVSAPFRSCGSSRRLAG